MTDRNRDWVLDDIAWHTFERTHVDPDILKIAKAAALVEFNGGDYARYLEEVFDDDPAFRAAARKWGAEEIRHGQALRRWVELADPDFDFDSCFARFAETIALPHNARASVRGSRCGELVARCLVEIGTSSFYMALADASDEPVFKEICRRIAADEVRHYKLFYTTMRKYQALEGVGFWRRTLVALQRIGEMQDDELPFAYYAANGPANGLADGYDRRANARAYAGRAFGYYQPGHVQRGLIMILQAVGLESPRLVVRWLAAGIYRLMHWRARRLVAAG